MNLKGKRIGIVMTGSYCTFEDVLPHIQTLKELGAELTPVFSDNTASTDSRFGTAQQWYDRLEAICGEACKTSIPQVEPIGPQKLLDLVVVAPCTGNTLAKLANGITDSAALMAVKSHLRNARPALLAIATNDGLGNNARNVGYLMNAKNIYFVPFGQDGPGVKNHSIQSKFSLIAQAAEHALDGQQLQPVLLGAHECLRA